MRSLFSIREERQVSKVKFTIDVSERMLRSLDFENCMESILSSVRERLVVLRGCRQ